MGTRIRDDLLAGAATLIFIGGLLYCAQPFLFPTAKQSAAQAAVDALLDRRRTCLELAQRRLAMGEDPFSLALAADTAAFASENDLALELYQRLPSDSGQWEFHREMGLARRKEILGRAAEMEQHLQRALTLNPQSVEAHDRMGHLLQVEGRVFEGMAHFLFDIRHGRCRGDELLALSSSDRFFRNDEHLEQVGLSRTPPELFLKLAHARRMVNTNQIAEVEKILREVVAVRPGLGEAQGRLGRLIAERGEPEDFEKWRRGLTEESRTHPEVWFAQAIYARRSQDLDGTIRCLLETLQQSPNHLAANLQMATCLRQAGRTAEAREYTRRSQLLSDLETTINTIRRDSDPPLVQKAIKLMGQLGRHWEAAGWSYVMTHMPVPKKVSQRELDKWLPLALRDSGLQSPAALPAPNLSPSQFPLPKSLSGTVPGLRGTGPHPAAAWKFTNDAERTGLNFQYYEGTSESNRMEHIFNTMGGGVGVIDYDLDGWPDVYLPQAYNWRAEPQSAHVDRLFRNRGGREFRDVTSLAGLGDQGFSHGVAVGDFDQDGFPDVYVGNLGANRLYRNNGDGTYEDVTTTAGVAGNEWSTSSVFADFTGDGLPDLFVLNYTKVTETRQKECQRPNGERYACTPDVLIPDADRFYVNNGNGTFRDASQAAGIADTSGRGLGIIAWDYGGKGRLGLFVANDTSANFFYENAESAADGTPQFQEEALVRGVAYDSEGHAMASMGVAADDLNADGRIELFVTTFFQQPKALYSQRPDRLFDEVCQQYRLKDPSFPLLGFGCQFADFNGDGWSDLVVTNGHVNQLQSDRTADRMRPQIYQSLQGRGFEEIPGSQLGDFFQKRYLGRGLAILDWNRDGRTDFVVSHLHAPVALLTNGTPPQGKPLVVRLIGTAGCREPTGATIRLQSGSETQYRLQTAGDGFLVTNERRAHFALPPGSQSASLQVTWPSGRVQSWVGIPGGHEVTFVEEDPQPYVQQILSLANE